MCVCMWPQSPEIIPSTHTIFSLRLNLAGQNYFTGFPFDCNWLRALIRVAYGFLDRFSSLYFFKLYFKRGTHEYESNYAKLISNYKNSKHQVGSMEIPWSQLVKSLLEDISSLSGPVCGWSRGSKRQLHELCGGSCNAWLLESSCALVFKGQGG